MLGVLPTWKQIRVELFCSFLEGRNLGLLGLIDEFPFFLQRILSVGELFPHGCRALACFGDADIRIAAYPRIPSLPCYGTNKPENPFPVAFGVRGVET
jgi:hypothetical protein